VNFEKHKVYNISQQLVLSFSVNKLQELDWWIS